MSVEKRYIAGAVKPICHVKRESSVTFGFQSRTNKRETRGTLFRQTVSDTIFVDLDSAL